jgi:hypothetical protein
VAEGEFDRIENKSRGATNPDNSSSVDILRRL